MNAATGAAEQPGCRRRADTYTPQNGPRDTGSVMAARYILTDKAVAYLDALDRERAEAEGS